MIGDIISWTFMTIGLIGSLFWCNFYPIWNLIYKPREVSNQIDKCLESLRVNLRLNPKNLNDLPASKINHILFSIWIFLFSSFNYLYCDTFYDFYNLNLLIVPAIVFFIYFSFKFSFKFALYFIEKYPEKKKLVSTYLNEEWKIGVFVLTFFLTLFEVLKKVAVYVLNLPLAKLITKTVKIFVVVMAILYVSLLMTTSLNIDRENFLQFCNRIHPALTDFTRNLYKGFDRRTTENKIQ
jgi:hypothetical protein